MIVFDVIRKKGISGILHHFVNRIFNPINKMIYHLCSHFSIKENWIVFESEGDLSDNAYALYSYMLKKEYENKYTFIWLVDDVKKAIQKSFKNTVFIKKFPGFINIVRSYYLARAKWCFYDHSNVYDYLGKRDNQTVVYLSHGFEGFKASKGKGIDESKVIRVILGGMSEEINNEYCNYKKLLKFGYPRNDYFFVDNKTNRDKLNQYYHINSYKKVLLWMPTFRQSKVLSLSEDYQKSETGLPLICSTNEMKLFNDYLQRNNVMVVLKVHHLQSNLPIFKSEYSNIVFINDDEIQKLDMQLYEFIPFFDALITDYSSISVDYLLLDKPMVFILDDYEEYKASRGLPMEDMKEYLPGSHVYSVEDFKNSIIDIVNNKDMYSLERNALLYKFYEFPDGNASKRILEYFNI